MAKAQGRCIFCGGTGLSKEHVFSLWTHNFLPREIGMFRRHRESRYHPEKDADYTAKVREGGVNTLKLRVVCEDRCNNGWMSQLDEAVKPILSPLILGQPASLDRHMQKTLATWIVTKMMVSEFSYPDDIVTPQSERESVMLTLTPPGNWQIWIAHCRAEKWRSGLTRMAMNIGPLDNPPSLPAGQKHIAKNTQLFSFGIGELLINAVSTTGEIRLGRPREVEKFACFLWPIADHILWPPGRIISEMEADACSNLLIHLFDRESRWFSVPRA
jgi:hypothetical protein